MNGLYDILESYRIQDPRFTYEGLYQDAPRKDTIYGSGRIKEYPYGLNRFTLDDIDSQRQAFLSSAFPQEYGVGSLFDPRVGKPEQSLSYNEPYFINAPQDFSQPIADPFQTDYPITRAIQEEKEDVATGILPQVDSRFPLYDDFTVAEEGDDLEENAVTVDELGNLKQPSGFKDFLKTMLGFAIPGAGLFTGDRSALQGIKSLNQRLRNTDFARSSSLADYLDAKSYGGRDERDAAAARTMAQARGLQKQVDRRGDSTSRVADRNRSSVTRSSAAKSKGVGGGGYTKSDSTRESYRGRY
jgi:hypothetical protein